MANKEKYIDGLRSRYADAPDEFLELCWLLHDCDKAKKYADLLYTCTSYADIAEKAVCPMYVSGDIDETRARSEKFLSLLIPLACLETGGNAHAAVYHVRQMLDRPDVRRERKSLDENRLKIWRATQEAASGQPAAPSCKVTIEITDTESMRMFIEFLKSAGTRFSVAENRRFQGLASNGSHAESIVIEETPQWFHAAFSDLHAHCPDAAAWTFCFQSDWIARDGIMLTEALELIGQELS